MSGRPNPALLEEVRCVARLKAGVPSAKEIAAKHRVSTRYVQELLRKVTRQGVEFVFVYSNEEKSG